MRADRAGGPAKRFQVLGSRQRILEAGIVDAELEVEFVVLHTSSVSDTVGFVKYIIPSNHYAQQ
jgi:hypothetical protein